MAKKSIMKVLCCVLALVMMLSVFAGCNNEKPVETKPQENKPAETKPGETTPAETTPVETTTAAPVETTPAPVEKTGCGGVIGGAVALVALISVAGCAVLKKNKE